MNTSGPLLRSLLARASSGRLSVLTYHRVLKSSDELLAGEPSESQFEHTMEWVKRLFRVIPLDEGVEGIRTGKLPERALAITFDDGYANNATVAAPILLRLGLHATFFVATGFLNGGRMFNDTVIEAVRGFTGDDLDLSSMGLARFCVTSVRDRREAISAILSLIKYLPAEQRAETAEGVARIAGVTPASDLMMSSQQLRTLANNGFGVGGHTVTHPILARLPRMRALREIGDGRDQLEGLTGTRVSLFAYPNGKPNTDYVAESVLLVRELGFSGAVSTSAGAARVGSDPFQVPRFTPWKPVPWRFTAQIASNLVRSKASYVV